MRIRIFDSNEVGDRHGKWINYEAVTHDAYKCSECGYVMIFESDGPKENHFYYCPHCGMRLLEVTE